MEDTLPAYEALLALCRSRKSVRRFSPKMPTQSQIQRIKEVALTSPFASGKKNWGLRVVTDPALIHSMSKAVQDRSGTLAEGVRADLKSGFLRYAANFHIFKDAPVLFVPTFRVQPSLSLMTGWEEAQLAAWERDNYLKSISCVAMLVLLAAESIGLAACLMTGPLLAQEKLAQLLELNSAHEIGAIIPVGYEDDR